MKKLLLLTSIAGLVATSGCLVAEGGHREHEHDRGEFHEHSEVIVGAPAVVVRPPEIIVR
jgi:hypothetical protein